MDRHCIECGTVYNLHKHHKVSRKQQPALINCEYNLVDLCLDHHTGAQGVHNGNTKLQKKLKVEFQEFLYEIFTEELLTREDIKESLKLNDRDTNKLVRALLMKSGQYQKEDVIRNCMGGKLII